MTAEKQPGRREQRRLRAIRAGRPRRQTKREQLALQDFGFTPCGNVVSPRSRPPNAVLALQMLKEGNARAVYHLRHADVSNDASLIRELVLRFAEHATDFNAFLLAHIPDDDAQASWFAAARMLHGISAEFVARAYAVHRRKMSVQNAMVAVMNAFDRSERLRDHPVAAWPLYISRCIGYDTLTAREWVYLAPFDPDSVCLQLKALQDPYFTYSTRITLLTDVVGQFEDFEPQQLFDALPLMLPYMAEVALAVTSNACLSAWRICRAKDVEAATQPDTLVGALIALAPDVWDAAFKANCKDLEGTANTIHYLMTPDDARLACKLLPTLQQCDREYGIASRATPFVQTPLKAL